MDPIDRPRPLPDGAMCTACGAPVPTRRIRILARRDDLAFVELPCAACGSKALGLLVPASSPDSAPILDVAGDGPAAHRAGGPGTARPVTDQDVDAIRHDLAAWHGDIVGWLERLERGDRRGSVVDR